MPAPSQDGACKPRHPTLGLLAVSCASVAVALVIGIGDSPTGLVLVYLAVSARMVVFAHRWRRMRSFLILLAASLVGFPVVVVRHNAFYAFAQVAADAVRLCNALGFLELV